MSGEYIPEDYHANQVSKFANKSYHAYLDMDKIIEAHLNVVKKFLEKLVSMNKKIMEYLDN